MYASVPMTAPATVIVKPVSPAVDRAMPKSMINAWSSASIMMLAGFRSRCTTLASCAATSPDATCLAIDRARGTGIRPSRSSTLERSEPWTYGIVMYLMPSISPKSWMRTTFLCVTWRASSSSRLNRFSISFAAAGSAIASGRMTLIATATSSSLSHAW